MEKKHTPGPWWFSKVGNNYDQWMIYSEADGKTLAIVYGKENAKIVTAAPELLEALKQAETSLANSVKNNEGGIAREVSLSILREAIANATEKED